MPQSQGPVVYALPESLDEDLNRLRQVIGEFQAGAVTAAQFKGCHVPLGIYEERQDGRYMLRVRLPAGALLPHQMRTLAAVASDHGNGSLHLTTRQDIQVHGVPLESVMPAVLALRAAGMATKGGGGNTVRNVTTCGEAGVCPHEAFDVEPYAVALTEFLLPDPRSYQLPRKYKLALSGCDRDCAGVAVNDLGFSATYHEGHAGFVVYAGGGLGARSAVGQRLEEFVPAASVCLVAEAVKRVFDARGNRENRNHARLRFLIEDIGFPAFRELYTHELAKLREAGAPIPALRPLPRPNPGASEDSRPVENAGVEGFAVWRSRNVSEQKQPGFQRVAIPVAGGDISADALRSLAAVVETYGEGVLRVSLSQNAELRWVSDSQLPRLHAQLDALGLARAEPSVLRHLVPCAGAGTCRLGICHSRGLARAIAHRLRGGSLDLNALGDLKIKISGCPNSCGRHATADIGLSGAKRRLQDRPVPHFTVHVGGRLGGSETRLADTLGAIPARNVPTFIEAFLNAFAASAQFPDLAGFLAAQDGAIRELLGANTDLPAFSQAPDAFEDWPDS
ncbi:MAG: nitrite/sulfite reductase [Armatimonadetes bacterium]|nr:nitrite/sulfite reductase [Armatimonadota bacterium]